MDIQYTLITTYHCTIYIAHVLVHVLKLRNIGIVSYHTRHEKKMSLFAPPDSKHRLRPEQENAPVLYFLPTSIRSPVSCHALINLHTRLRPTPTLLQRHTCLSSLPPPPPLLHKVVCCQKSRSCNQLSGHRRTRAPRNLHL